MTRTQFVKQIEQGNYLTYHMRKIDGMKIPVSNSDSKTSNNLDQFSEAAYFSDIFSVDTLQSR